MTPQRMRPAGSAFDALVRLVDECGGPVVVAEFLGKARSGVYKWTDPDQSDGAPFNTVALMTEHFGATAAAEHLSLRAGGVFVPIPPRGVSPRWGRLTASAASTFAAAMHEIAEALDEGSDGGSRLTPREAQAIVEDIDFAIRDLAALRARALGAGGEGGR